MAEYWYNDEEMIELFKQQKEYKNKTLIFHKFNTRWAPEIWNYGEEKWEQYEPTMLEYTIQGIDIKNFLEENKGFKHYYEEHAKEGWIKNIDYKSGYYQVVKDTNINLVVEFIDDYIIKNAEKTAGVKFTNEDRLKYKQEFSRKQMIDLSRVFSDILDREDGEIDWKITSRLKLYIRDDLIKIRPDKNKDQFDFRHIADGFNTRDKGISIYR